MALFMAVVGLVLGALVVSLLLRQGGMPVFALLLALAVSALVLLRLLPVLAEVLAVFQQLAEAAGLNSNYLRLILKIIAVSYVAEFAAGLCRDAGESAYASKVELAGKITVMVLAVPVVVNILELVLQILP